MLPERPIWEGKSNTTILKAKIDLEGQIFEGNTKNDLYKVYRYLKDMSIPFQVFLHILQFHGLQGLFWPLKMLNLTFLPKLAFEAI